MLVNCVAYQNGRKLADIADIDEISDYLGRPDAFVWVALKDPDRAELERMGEEFGLHELALEDARHGHQAPKIEEYGDSLFVVLHTVDLNAQKQIEEGEVAIFVGKNYILSVRQRSSIGFMNVRERCEREPDLLKHGAGFVLYALIDAVVDRYFPVEAHLERELELIEERIFNRGGDARSNIEELYTLKRQLVILQHAAAPLLEVTGKLFGGRVPQVCYGMGEYYRDVFDHVARILKSVEGIREMTITAMQVNLSFINLSESEVTKKLAAYGALFAVPTAVAGIYGMNFQNMPELKSEWGYPLVLLIIVLVDMFLWLRFRRAGWV